MARPQSTPTIPLPASWPLYVKSAMLYVISLAQYALSHTCSWAVNCRVARVRLKAENDQLKQEVALLTEAIRIQDSRMKRVDAQKRPHYGPTAYGVIIQPISDRTCPQGFLRLRINLAARFRIAWRSAWTPPSTLDLIQAMCGGLGGTIRPARVIVTRAMGKQDG